MKALLIRNLRVYFRDRASVFFSLLSVLIIFLLYTLFLGNVWAGSSSFTGAQGVRGLMDSWLMAGLLAVVSVTSTMGAFGIMVEDKSRKIIKDFYSSPLSRAGLTGGYILSAFIIGLIMSLITAVFALIYMFMRGGVLPSATALVKTLGLVAITTLSNTAIVFFLVSLIGSANAFTTASTLIGTLIGFLTGVYIPIGQLPLSVQTLIQMIPTSHAAALFRQVLMEEPLHITFSGAPAETLTAFKDFLGARLTLGAHTFTVIEHILVLAAAAILFSLLSFWSLSRKKK